MKSEMRHVLSCCLAPISVDPLFQLDDCKVTDFCWEGVIAEYVLIIRIISPAARNTQRKTRVIPGAWNGTSPAFASFAAGWYLFVPAAGQSSQQEPVY